ncbi:hypothetical protein GCM10027203_63180 [Nonomuraea fastidiosa]
MKSCFGSDWKVVPKIFGALNFGIFGAASAGAPEASITAVAAPNATRPRSGVLTAFKIPGRPGKFGRIRVKQVTLPALPHGQAPPLANLHFALRSKPFRPPLPARSPRTEPLPHRPAHP